MSAVLVTLHWVVTSLNVSWCLTVMWPCWELTTVAGCLLSATSLTAKQWPLNQGFFLSPSTHSQQHLHPSQLPAPCHIRLLEPLFTQLGMRDQANWEEARAWIIATLSWTKRDQQSVYIGNLIGPQTPERLRHKKSVKAIGNKQNGAKRRQQRADNKNKDKCVSSLAFLTATVLSSVAPCSYHIIKLFIKGKHNTATTRNNTDTTNELSHQIIAKIL